MKLLRANFRFDPSPLATRTIFTLEMSNFFPKLWCEKAFNIDELRTYKIHTRSHLKICHGERHHVASCGASDARHMSETLPPSRIPVGNASEPIVILPFQDVGV